MIMIQCVVLLVLLVLCVLGFNSNIIIHKDEMGNSITANVVSMFTEHNIFIHYDGRSSYRVDSIMNKILLKNRNTLLMSNYDQYLNDDNITTRSDDYFNYIRPVGYKFLHIVMIYNFSTFEQYTAANMNSFEYLDIILIIKRFHSNGKHAQNISDFDIFVENVNRAGAFFLLDVSNFTLYSNCFYCGERQYIWEFVANFLNATDTDYFLTKLKVNDILENQFTDLSGHVFAVGYTNYKPFFWSRIETKNNETAMTVMGSEGEILFALQEKLNIYFQMIEIKNLDNVWFTITETIQNGTYDWIVGGVTASLSRIEKVEFTSTISDEIFVVLYTRTSNPWMSWLSILLPFQLNVWITLLMTALVIATILFAIAKSIRPKPKRKVLFSNFIQGTLRYLVEQPLPIVRNYLKTRWTVIFISTLWMLSAQIMTNSYKSKIMSSLINFKGLEYMNVEELLNQNFHFYIHSEDENMVKENLQYSNDSTFMEVLKKSEVYNDFCAKLLKIGLEKKAMIGQLTVIQHMVKNNCSGHVHGLRILKDSLFPCIQAWPLAKNVPYLVALNTIIARLNAGGFISQWNKEYMPVAKTIPRSNEKRVNNVTKRSKFTLTNMIGPLFLWSLGITIATIVFLNELRLGKHLC